MSTIDIRWEELSQKEKVLATIVVGGLYVVEYVSHLSHYIYEKGKEIWKTPWYTKEEIMLYTIRYEGEEDEEEREETIIFYG